MEHEQLLSKSNTKLFLDNSEIKIDIWQLTIMIRHFWWHHSYR